MGMILLLPSLAPVRMTMIPTRNSLLPARQYARRQGREIVGEGEEIHK